MIAKEQMVKLGVDVALTVENTTNMQVHSAIKGPLFSGVTLAFAWYDAVDYRGGREAITTGSCWNGTGPKCYQTRWECPTVTSQGVISFAVSTPVV